MARQILHNVLKGRSTHTSGVAVEEEATPNGPVEGVAKALGAGRPLVDGRSRCISPLSVSGGVACLVLNEIGGVAEDRGGGGSRETKSAAESPLEDSIALQSKDRKEKMR